jgi:Bcr/CflA subfamily drug resistance transporter
MQTAHRQPLWLLILLIMFPQLVETIYSPVLPDIARSFGISSERAAQTLTVYFIAFAVGVAFWGFLCDRIGRRPAMMLGLTCYGAGTMLALTAPNFSTLLLARMVAALGAAAGSVVVQTMLRDTYESARLARVFSIIGAALAVSPVFGLISGGWIASFFGHKGVFIALSLLAVFLLVLTATLLKETLPAKTIPQSIGTLALRMMKDTELWRSAFLIALFNGMIFSYYSLAPFLFERVGWNTRTFGWTGLILAASSFSGSLLNRKLLASGLHSDQLIRHACVLALLSGLMAWHLQDSAWILVPVIGVIVAYGIAIPNVLSRALRHYREQVGTAGALFGFSYYLLLGLSLGLAGFIQQLGFVFTIFALAACLCCPAPRR